jgi:hypothetical protein
MKLGRAPWRRCAVLYQLQAVGKPRRIVGPSGIPLMPNWISQQLDSTSLLKDKCGLPFLERNGRENQCPTDVKFRGSQSAPD